MSGESRVASDGIVQVNSQVFSTQEPFSGREEHASHVFVCVFSKPRMQLKAQEVEGEESSAFEGIEHVQSQVFVVQVASIGKVSVQISHAEPVFK